MSCANAVLVNHPGPLPISFQFTPTSDITETIWFSGSVIAGDIAMVNIGFKLLVDGKEVGKSMICAGDTRSNHHTTVPVMVNYDIPFVIADPENTAVKPVTIELVLCSDSFSDKNDKFNVTIFT